MQRTLLVTVGTTKFDEILRVVGQVEFQQHVLQGMDIKRIAVQRGSSAVVPESMQLPWLLYSIVGRVSGLSIQPFEYSPELQCIIDSASFVILHCGAGSVLEVLHSKKRAIAVVNPNLLDNHQEELADALESSGLMAVARSPDQILDVLKNTDWSKITRYAAPDLSLFPRELGTLIKLD